MPHYFGSLAALDAIRSPLVCTPGLAIAGSFDAAACLVPIPWSVTVHVVVWGDVLCCVYAHARHRGRPHDDCSLEQAFYCLRSVLGTRAPSARRFIYDHVAPRHWFCRSGMWRSQV